ncbi:alpha/beta fold hydrolase [Gilvimarinus sp. F26214L]|uniref:alpha/beta fold hydrolase n=1 Tax=Gilvimarinus sp. DZF01 TaxID=3461371 RepID=UPI0040457709
MSGHDAILLRTIESHGITARIADKGEGPLVLMLHGWPESWYSWRHQIRALAEAGYRAVAPDMPGYGSTQALPSVESYNVRELAAFVVGVIDAVGETEAILVGHDWGAAIAWSTVQLYPHRFRALVNMSVPLWGHPPVPPTRILRKRFGDNFFYQLYFQDEGVAEAEFDADPRAILFRLLASPDSFRNQPEVEDPHKDAGGWIPRLGEPRERPDWLSEEDLEYFVAEFQRAGFRGGINYYRNIDRNWEIMAEFADRTIDLPCLFLAGEKDMVIMGASREALLKSLGARVTDLRDVILLPGIGHWIQQEAAAETNQTIIGFLKTL